MNNTKINLTKKIDKRIINTNLIKISKDVLVLVYTHNDENILVNTLNQIKRKCNFDFLILDNNSTDKTVDLAKTHGWKCIESPQVNTNNELLFKQALNYAIENNYKYIIQYDLKKQFNYNDLLSMSFYSQKGYDLVLCVRHYNKTNQASLFENQYKFIKFLFKLKTKQKINDPSCTLLMFNWTVIDLINKNNKIGIDPSGIAYIIKKNKLKVREIPIVVYAKDDHNKNVDNIKNKWLIGFKLFFLAYYNQWRNKSE